MACRCKMRYINCEPEDRFETVLICDATKAQVDVKCNYIKTTGTSYTESIATSMSIDRTVKAEMEANFFEIFKAKLSVSVSTGYNWNSVSSETISEEESFGVEAVAPKGYILRIGQVSH